MSQFTQALRQVASRWSFGVVGKGVRAQRRLTKRAQASVSAVVETCEPRQLMTFQGFAAPTFVENAGFPPKQVAVGDLNRDGIPDLVTADSGNNVVKFALGRGDGSFGAIQTLTPGGTEVSNPIVADLNRDGLLDIAVTSRSLGYSVKVFLGNGNGTFNGATTSFLNSFLPSRPVVGDFNGDGNADLATPTISVDPSTSMAYSVAKILLGNGNGSFRDGGTVQLSLDRRTDESVQSADVGDINGDGRLDLVFAHRGSGTVSVLNGNGNGTFQTPQRISIGNSAPSAVKLADLNGDGRLDIVVAKSSTNAVSVGTNNGSSGFTFRDTSVGIRPESLAIGDVNRDGRLDVMTANLTSDTLTLLPGASGGFGTASQISAGDASNLRIQPSDIVLADVNRDGQLDALVGHSYQGASPRFTDKSTAVGVLLGRDVVENSTIQFGAATYSVNENAGTLSVTLTRTSGLSESAWVEVIAVIRTGQSDWATIDQDFQAPRTTLTFAPGETSKTYTVSILDDRIIEPNEKFGLYLLNASSNVTYGANRYTEITIRDDDKPNLKITGVSLIDSAGNTVTTPQAGNAVAVRVTFESSGLAAGTTYTVAVQVGGTTWNYNLNWGAGLNGTGSWILQTGLFAWSGSRQVVGVNLDSVNAINEAFEDDNYLGRIYGSLV